MPFNINDRVTVVEKPLHGNHSLLTDGSVVGISGNSAKIQIDGEDFPRDFSLDKLQSSEATYGAQLTSHHDHAVINAIRRY